MVEADEIELISSEALEYENDRNRSPLRRQWVQQCLDLASQFQSIDDDVSSRATLLEAEGIKQLDALHVACSERANCGYFLTCDDSLNTTLCWFFACC